MDVKVYKGVPILETNRLIIRQVSIEDIEYIYNHMKNKEVRKYFEKFWPKDIEGVERFVSEAVQRNENDQAAEWVIFLKDEKKVIGRIWFGKFLDWCSAVHVGYSLDHYYWSRGIVSEALDRVIAFGFDEMHLRRIEAWHDSSNIASGKVMVKCGLTFEGTLRERGDSGNAEMYSILETEYKGKKEK